MNRDEGARSPVPQSTPPLPRQNTVSKTHLLPRPSTPDGSATSHTKSADSYPRLRLPREAARPLKDTVPWRRWRESESLAGGRVQTIRVAVFWRVHEWEIEPSGWMELGEPLVVLLWRRVSANPHPNL